MAKRRVLIVDDSKTAQIRLRKMLERFDLEADTVLSAEEALGYLSYRQPAIIFLDHHMEGMDGLEALKIIKSNPATALIPVIMYTSEKGDVYVGQARALGAIDILGKEVMKHANLEKVLGSLGIGSAARPPEQDAQPTSPSSPQPETAPSVAPQVRARGFGEGDDDRASTSYEAEESSDLDRMQQQVSRLFEIHIAKVRQEIDDSTKFLLRRISRELQDKKPAPARAQNIAPAQDSPPPEDLTDYSSATEDRSNISPWILGLVLVAIGFLGYHLYVNNQQQSLLVDQYQQLVQRSRGQEELVNRLLAQVGEGISARSAAQNFADRQILMDALGWAVNVNTQVDFGEQALNDQRIYTLGELLSLLKAASFSGAVYLDVHLGNFCVVQDPSGQWMLPEPESNLEDCVFMAEAQQETPIDDQVSVGFMNYLQSAPILAEGDIEVELASQGYASPRFSYPPVTGATSAGEWNTIAQKNNRISVSFAIN